MSRINSFDDVMESDSPLQSSWELVEFNCGPIRFAFEKTQSKVYMTYIWVTAYEDGMTDMYHLIGPAKSLRKARKVAANWLISYAKDWKYELKLEKKGIDPASVNDISS